MTAQTSEWWQDGPVFSTSRRGSRIVAVAPDADVPRLGWIHVLVLLLGSVLCGVCVTIVLPGSLPPLLAAPGWSAWNLIWWIPLALGAAWVLIMLVPVTYSLFEDDFGQSASVGIRAGTTVVSAGLATALNVWSVPVGEHSESFIAELMPLLRWGAAGAAAVAACAAALLLLGIHGVRREIARILCLREDARRVAGEIVTVPEPKMWILERPQFRVAVRFYDGAAPRTIDVWMSTTPARVPMPGSGVLVYFSGSRTHVDVDPASPEMFDGDVSRYTAPSGGGGN
ncbi:hypothetical protein ACI7YT_05205 [Microbacterium sp. M]|uniref:hypothetical protein n=1 Tax=Microbacterium sp. M TaxID=3377125 RepID=UPI00386780A4